MAGPGQGDFETRGGAKVGDLAPDEAHSVSEERVKTLRRLVDGADDADPILHGQLAQTFDDLEGGRRVEATRDFVLFETLRAVKA